MIEAAAVPSWFVGAWKREWIQRRGQPKGETFIVCDVQTPVVFGSVRIPKDRPSFRGVTGPTELSDADLALLVEQQGFAGFTTCEGDTVTWHHEIDLQPDAEHDTGRLVQVGTSSVHEYALDGAYVEHWWSLSRGEGRCLGIRVLGADGRAQQILSVVGDHFVYARGRPNGLAVEGARARLLRLLDCEFSYGLIRGGAQPWEVRHSTLPWREGAPLPFAVHVGLAHGNPVPRLGLCADGEGFTVPVDTMSADDKAVLFSERG